MHTFYNFETKKVINPLETIEQFFVSPYMKEGEKTLDLVGKVQKHSPDIVVTDWNEFLIHLLPIGLLITGNVMIKWNSADSFVINKKIYCKIITEKIIRIDTVLS